MLVRSFDGINNPGNEEINYYYPTSDLVTGPDIIFFWVARKMCIRDRFMIDCGEGAQLQFRKSHLKFSRLNHIFISNLHGDHCFGLLGLISTLNL